MGVYILEGPLPVNCLAHLFPRPKPRARASTKEVLNAENPILHRAASLMRIVRPTEHVQLHRAVKQSWALPLQPLLAILHLNMSTGLHPGIMVLIRARYYISCERFNGFETGLHTQSQDHPVAHLHVISRRRLRTIGSYPGPSDTF